MNPATTTTPQPSRIARSWSLTKSAWHAIKADKELFALPVMSMFAGLGVLIIFGVIAILLSTFSGPLISENPSVTSPLNSFNWISILYGFGVYLASAFVANYYGAALTHGVVTRLRGGDPTIRSSLKGARSHIGAIFLFSLFASTVGYVLKALEERLPWLGALIARFAGFAWTIASMFAIPVIVTSDRHVGPIDATRQSASIIKRTWGENVLINIGMGLVSGLTVMAYILISIITGALIFTNFPPQGSAVFYTVVPFVGLGIIGLFALMLLFTMLSAVAKTVIFYYATTGEAPETFDRKLIEASFTPKQARKTFA